MDVNVKLSFISLLKTTIDLCDDSEDGVLMDTGISCPIAAGEYTLTKTFELPDGIPGVEITVETRGYTYDEEDMFCVDVVADFAAMAVGYREGL